jgi:hypothetical protein
MTRNDRGKSIRNHVGLILYLCGGWRSYRDISGEFGWAIDKNGHCKTARRNVRALEEAGLPMEWMSPPEPHGRDPQRVRLPQDWVARTVWLRRYIIRKEPLNASAYTRSLHK